MSNKTKCRSNQCLRVGIFENGICPKCTALMKQGFKKRKPIKKISDKRKAQNDIYIKLRNQFLKDNPICAVTGNKATEVHHMRGRIGNLLTDVRYFLPVSRIGHKQIEEFPIWAILNGFSLKRTNA